MIDALVSQSLMATTRDVERVMSKSSWTVEDMPVLLSEAAQPFIEDMAQAAHRITTQRFGHTMQMFIPMYLSNECFNTCTYCGFSMEHKYERKTLNDEEIVAEAKLLASKGFQHILLLTGESPKRVGVDYIAHAIGLVKPFFSSVGVEIQPLDENGYRQLIESGADSLTLYQETYHRDQYAKYHLFGLKKDYDNRLKAVEHGAKAGFYRINLGALLGLSDWRYDGLALANHVSYMRKTYWQTKYSVSFPRINGMVGEFEVEYPVSDMILVQLITAFRMVFNDIGITLSTREPARLRDQLLSLGVTTMSAESSTAPGGYSQSEAEKQFDISDERALEDVLQAIKSKGYEPVMKDWDQSFVLA